MVKDRYEISLWEDYIVPATDTIPEHFEERKIAVIGSDTMTAQCRAVEPKLVENINGTNTLTFKMFYTYLDVETGEKYQNPFLSLLVNERKIKALWKGKWYDLVIKNIQEDSSGKSIVYTCKDLYINELSKTGFEVIFDQEKENDIQSLEEFAAETLEGSDWRLGEVDDIKQEKEEPVYEVKLEKLLSCKNQTEGVSEEIPVEAKVLFFYNQFQNIINSTLTEGQADFQFAYASTYSRDVNSQLVNNTDCYIANFKWKKGQVDGVECLFLIQKEKIDEKEEELTIAKVFYKTNISTQYRAKRLVESYETRYDKKIDRYVDVYEYKDSKGNTKELHGYQSSEFKSPTVVGNIITNSKDFKDTSGWIKDQYGSIHFEVYSKSNTENVKDLVDAKSCLVFKESQGNRAIHYINTGLTDTLFLSEGLKKGQKFIFRYKARFKKNEGGTVTKNYVKASKDPTFTLRLIKYSYDDNTISFTGKSYLTQKGNPQQNGDWVEHTFTCNASLSKSKILSQEYGLVVTAPAISGGDYKGEYWIEEIQFFEYVEGEVYNDKNELESRRINPGEYETLGKNIVFYNYYDPDSSYTNEEDLDLLYSGTEDWPNEGYEKPSGLTRKSNGFTKKRKVAVKNSNRFNILQTLAETFECWVRFEIEHNPETGKVNYDEETGLPIKKVHFKKEVGKETGVGFIYGQDLKSISRTIVSDQIVTKTIVTPNNNEYAPNGSCDIRASEENYPKTNFLLDFGYYINQGLLDGSQLNKDLYLSTDSIGYYYHLSREYAKYLSFEKTYSELKKNLDELSALEKTYNTIVTEALGNITEEQGNYKIATNEDYKKSKVFGNNNEVLPKIRENAELYAIVQKIVSLQSTYQSYNKESDNITKAIADVAKEIKSIEKQRQESLDKIKSKNEEFYSKYSRFIQEGSWTSEDYTDPNLYYLDAQSVAYTSSRPQISYNISVLRLSALEEYKNKVFNIGDISFIQDTEFFGYEWIDQVKTPYKEKVLISEIVSNFDSPEQDSFKIQNYKTQFEDLFQRITATTQSLQYAQGQYQRAANAFTETGEIKFETLQNSILLNQELVIGATNESVVQDSTGLTVTDLKNPNNKTKITSGGVFVSTDGGKTWKGAIRGGGVSTQYLASGAINTSNIVITSGDYTTFKWDNLGISAYDTILVPGWETIAKEDGSVETYEKSIIGINLSKFVRFDRFGIYGINGYRNKSGELSSFVPENEDEIWNNASYALTWKGFLLKNKYGDGYVSINSEEDFIVSDGTYNRIKIGKIGEDENSKSIFGIRFKNKIGETTLETDDGGNLWLKNKLSIGTLYGNNVIIGNLGWEDFDYEHGGRVINANDTFIVYEDGHIVANSGSFRGHIEATSGKIGNVSIGTIEDFGNIAENVQETIDELLSVNITNTSLQALVNNKILSFSNEGLSLVNTGFTIYKDNYIKVEGTLKEFDQNLDYYIEKEGAYVKVETLETPTIEYVDASFEEDGSFKSNEIYYEKKKDSYVITEDKERVVDKQYYNKKNNPIFYCDVTIIDNSGKENVYKEETFVEKFNPQTTYYTLDKAGNYEKYNIFKSPEATKTYYNNNIEPLFYFDDLTQSLTLKGAIYAESGSFKGNLEAKSGNIGGFIIKEEALYDKNSFIEEVTKAEDEDFDYRNVEEGQEEVKFFKEDLVYYEFKNGEYVAVSDTIADNDKDYYFVTRSSDLMLDGTNSIIKTNRIELGTGAKIVDYISLGDDNVRIQNPDRYSGVFIKTKEENFIINTSTEQLKLGQLTLDAANSSIYGDSFSITPNLANFNNVNVRGKITSSVFEVGHTQVVGGSMVFKQSYKIRQKEVEKTDDGIIYSLFFDEDLTNSLNGLPYITLVNKNGQISQNFEKIKNYTFELNYVLSEDEGFREGIDYYEKIGENYIKTSDSDFNSEKQYYIIAELKTTIYIYITNENYNIEEDFESIIVLGHNNDMIISINSESYSNDIVGAHGLTMYQLSIDEQEVLQIVPKLFLGDLGELDTNFGIIESESIAGYGLYCDNVFLTGSLTTQTGENSYAGVNTLNGVAAIKFGTGENDDKSKIVFWAGAADNTSGAIQNANFQVTEAGSIYASQGFFEDSVIAHSRITGADIYAARLHGVELDEGNPTENVGALTIYDTNAGIVFKTGFNIRDDGTIDEGTETFSIGQNGLKVSENYFIDIREGISFIGNYGKIENIQTGSINIGSLGTISLISNTETFAREVAERNTIQILKRIDKDNKSSLELTDNSYYFKVFGTNTSYIMKVNQQQSEINTNQLKIKENLMVGDENTNIEYKKVSGGYDLYVYGS